VVPLCEWCFRVCSASRPLWRRYAYIVPEFTFLAVGELVGTAATTGGEKRWIARLGINSATVKETGHQVKSPITGDAAATSYLRANCVGGNALRGRLWRLAFEPHLVALSTVLTAHWTVPTNLA
jgi:hypothetical protein